MALEKSPSLRQICMRFVAADLYILARVLRETSVGGDDQGPRHVLPSVSPSIMSRSLLILHGHSQGTYSKNRDIVVLCAYLGQLVQIRKALASEVTTVIDERDAMQLIDHGENEDVAGTIDGAIVENVKVSSRV